VPDVDLLVGREPRGVVLFPDEARRAGAWHDRVDLGTWRRRPPAGLVVPAGREVQVGQLESTERLDQAEDVDAGAHGIARNSRDVDKHAHLGESMAGLGFAPRR